MTRLRVGILGHGGIAARHAASVAALSDDMALVAVAGRDHARVSAFTDRHGGTPVVGIDALLATGIDLMIDTVPPYARGGEAERAARAGVHLLVEKPIALDVARAAAMVREVDAAGVIAAVGFMYRHGDAVRRWAASEPGRVAMMTGSFHCNALHAPWWRERAKSGGQVVEQLIHIVDLVRVFMDEPDTVYARTANILHGDVPGYDIEDVSAIVFGWDDGRIAALNASNVAVPGRWDKRWSLFAERATAHFTDWNTAAFTRTVPTVEDSAWTGDTDPFVAQLADLAGAIRDRRPPRVPLAEGLATLRLVQAAALSARARREVRIADAV